LINPNHEIALLANNIDWNYFENEFKSYYSNKSAPSVPIRQMAGYLLLKHLHNLGDDRIPEYWVRDVYTKMKHSTFYNIKCTMFHFGITYFSANLQKMIYNLY